MHLYQVGVRAESLVQAEQVATARHSADQVFS